MASTLRITHRWSNLGWGYCPTNIPQWKDKYQVAFALLDKNTLQPKYTFLDSEPALSDWIEGSPKTYTFNLKLTDVAAGDYLWGCWIGGYNQRQYYRYTNFSQERQIDYRGLVEIM